MLGWSYYLQEISTSCFQSMKSKYIHNIITCSILSEEGCEISDKSSIWQWSWIWLFFDIHRKNEWTEKDTKTINLNMIDDIIGVMPPKYNDIDIRYACSTKRMEYYCDYIFFKTCWQNTSTCETRWYII